MDKFDQGFAVGIIISILTTIIAWVVTDVEHFYLTFLGLLIVMIGVGITFLAKLAWIFIREELDVK